MIWLGLHLKSASRKQWNYHLKVPSVHTHKLWAPSLLTNSSLPNVFLSPWHLPLIIFRPFILTQMHTHSRGDSSALSDSRKICCCQHFCKVNVDCHCKKEGRIIYSCLPPQTVNSFPSSIINSLWINDSLLFWKLTCLALSYLSCSNSAPCN